MYALLQQAFSENGSLLASVGEDDNHSLVVHDWEKGSLYHAGPSDTRTVRTTLPLSLIGVVNIVWSIEANVHL